MAKFYTVKTTAGGLRYFVTKSEAMAALDLARAGSMSMPGSMAGSLPARCPREGEGEVDEGEVDERAARSMAARWLNLKAVNQENALKREANKTAKQRSDNMRKAWATRRKNTES